MGMIINPFVIICHNVDKKKTDMDSDMELEYEPTQVTMIIKYLGYLDQYIWNMILHPWYGWNLDYPWIQSASTGDDVDEPATVDTW